MSANQENPENPMEEEKLPIKLEIIILVLFLIFGALIIEVLRNDPDPDSNIEKYLFYLSIDFSVLLFMIILIICKLMKIFKHKEY